MQIMPLPGAYIRQDLPPMTAVQITHLARKLADDSQCGEFIQRAKIFGDFEPWEQEVIRHFVWEAATDAQFLNTPGENYSLAVFIARLMLSAPDLLSGEEYINFADFGMSKFNLATGSILSRETKMSTHELSFIFKYCWSQENFRNGFLRKNDTLIAEDFYYTYGLFGRALIKFGLSARWTLIATRASHAVYALKESVQRRSFSEFDEHKEIFISALDKGPYSIVHEDRFGVYKRLEEML